MIFHANYVTSKSNVETPPLLIRDGGVIAEGYEAAHENVHIPLSKDR